MVTVLAIYTTFALCLATPKNRMNKDAFFAALIGLGIGLVLTGIILVGPNLMKSLPKVTIPKVTFLQKKPTPEPTKISEILHSITIDSPLPDAIENTDTMLVSGSTSKESKVIIQGTIDDSVMMTNGDGKFAGKITLVEGKNDILVTSYYGEKTATQKTTVYYTPEDW